MVKKRGLIAAIMAVIILSSLNLFLFLSRGRFSYITFKTNLENKINFTSSLDLPLLTFVFLWVIIFLIIIIMSKKLQKKIKTEKRITLELGIMKQKKSKSATDIDILYEILKKRKKLSTGEISRIFKIENEKALEWAKIFENHNLATIEYPAFDDPEIKIKEEEEDLAKEENEKDNITLANTSPKKNNKLMQSPSEVKKKNVFKKIKNRRKQKNEKEKTNKKKTHTKPEKAKGKK